MINDVGHRILRERGVEDIKPDFGIEIVAEEGLAFRKGSVRATIAITRYVDVGILAAGELISTTSALSVKKRGTARPYHMLDLSSKLSP